MNVCQAPEQNISWITRYWYNQQIITEYVNISPSLPLHLQSSRIILFFPRRSVGGGSRSRHVCEARDASKPSGATSKFVGVFFQYTPDRFLQKWPFNLGLQVFTWPTSTSEHLHDELNRRPCPTVEQGFPKIWRLGNTADGFKHM